MTATDTDLRATAAGWVPVCRAERLTPDRGVAALVDGRAVAVFALSTGEVWAIDDVDPFTGAGVLSRGLVGDLDGTPTVASPLHKQRFDLRTGRCLDDDAVAVATHAARIVDGTCEVQVAP